MMSLCNKTSGCPLWLVMVGVGAFVGVGALLPAAVQIASEVDVAALWWGAYALPDATKWLLIPVLVAAIALVYRGILALFDLANEPEGISGWIRTHAPTCDCACVLRTLRGKKCVAA